MGRRLGLDELATRLDAGLASSRDLLEAALARATASDPSGRPVFIRLYEELARASAAASDHLRTYKNVASPLSGIPVAVTDSFDVVGETTTAGSVVFADAPPAVDDARVITRLRAAGAVLVGRTNMSEFGYSALGINPHYGTPGNPADASLIAGGASCGAAVAIASGMAAVAVASDTYGSLRIPAALCGVVGFKPTASRVPLDGMVPLSPTLDSIGPIGPDVESCAITDAVLSGTEPYRLDEISADGLRLAIPLRYVLDDLDTAVAGALESTLIRLKAAGVRLVEVTLGELEEIPSITAGASFASVEGWAWHRSLLKECEDQYDPRVAERLKRGADASAADYIELINARRDLMRRVSPQTAPFDAVIFPTVPQVAPPIGSLQSDYLAYNAVNSLFQRNAAVANFLDRCAVTIPCHPAGALPVGLTVMGETGADLRLLAVARAVERALTA